MQSISVLKNKIHTYVVLELVLGEYHATCWVMSGFCCLDAHGLITQVVLLSLNCIIVRHIDHCSSLISDCAVKVVTVVSRTQ